MSSNPYADTPASKEASDYFNSLPREERAKLAPLLEQYRVMGLADARQEFDLALRHIEARIHDLRRLQEVSGAL